MTSSDASSQQPQFGKAKPVLIGAAVLLVIIVVVLSRSSGSSAKSVNGILTYVDASKRLAAAEILDPIANVKKEVLGEFPPDCVITINGAPAELSDLRVGDKVLVMATRLKEKRPSGAQAVAKSVEVTR